jgi:hypothetical protein
MLINFATNFWITFKEKLSFIMELRLLEIMDGHILFSIKLGSLYIVVGNFMNIDIFHFSFIDFFHI